MEHCLSILSCPLCQTSLTHTGKTLQCLRAHSFDLAREGYVNFLLKRSPGDTKEMLLARRTFLERGHYNPLAVRINQFVSTYLSEKGRSEETFILDAGCGEGFYLGGLQRYLDEQARSHVTCLGLDISRDAIKLASRKYRECCFMIASINDRLTLVDRSIHALLNIFAPRNPAEFARVITSGGLLVIVIPNPNHLQSLRSSLHLLNIEEQKQQHILDQFSQAFRVQATTTLEYDLHLNTAEISDLLMMTPNYWHSSRQRWDNLAEVEQLQTQASFTCLLLLRRNG